MRKSEASGSQVERFREAARELGHKDDVARFNNALRRVGKAPPPGAAATTPKTNKPGQ